MGLQDANRLKDEFLATLSHELRTPLNAILGYANMSGKMRLHVQPVNIGDVVRHAVEAMLPAAAAKGVRVDVAIGERLHVFQGDADRLQQVAWNLMSNAVKFTPRGGQISVSVRRAGSQLEIVVRDSGVGISPAFLPHVFDRFRQGESGVRRPGGLGLGLNITKQLVELHGGTIAAESEGDGKGAEFRVTLPA